jgi:hypothetical protein
MAHPRQYRVVMSKQTENRLKELHAKAAQTGTSHRFMAAMRRIVERLRTDPLVFGEPLYRLPSLKLMVRHAAIHPLVVAYAVHEEQPLVFIRWFKVLS